MDVRIKDTFWRLIKSIPLNGTNSLLRIRCHKYRCKACGRYFNNRIPGIQRWSRVTEPLKRAVFALYNKGYSCKDIAEETHIGVSSVERYYHQMLEHKSGHWKNRPCPRVLGIDEHRFTRRQGFLTTFCDLGKMRIFDLAKGKSEADLTSFLQTLQGRERVRVVCIDLNSGYRQLVRKWFPNARIVADRFHVIRLVNEHFSELCKTLDETSLKYGRGRLLRLFLRRPDRLTPKQKARLDMYLSTHPVHQGLYNFMQACNALLRTAGQNARSCRKCVQELLEKLRQLREIAFAPLKTLGNTLTTWQEEVARMFRFSRNNGITEGFHRKMKLIQRRAYGFRSFENYRLRVRVLCG